MLATETECSKYRIEMIIHQREAEALESKVSARFQGNLIPIDEGRCTGSTSKLPGYHPMPSARWGRGPQLGGPGRLPMEPQNAPRVKKWKKESAGSPP